MNSGFHFKIVPVKKFQKEVLSELYMVMLIPEGHGKIVLDSGVYSYSGPSLIFLAPTQRIQIITKDTVELKLLEFHGDFYCIEYHKEEVACNGLLFNNIFLRPHIELSEDSLIEVESIFQKIIHELKSHSEFDRSVQTAYLQLLLAISSRIKKEQLTVSGTTSIYDKKMEEFQKLVDENFLNLSKPSEYAAKLRIDSNSLTKRAKKTFGKSPSNIIQERILLEAKKQLHLTRKSVKEVAYSLNFKDEHYFSRFFKKGVGLSPIKYREKVGISIVADLSKR